MPGWASAVRIRPGFTFLSTVPAVAFVAALGLWPLGAFLLGGFRTADGDASLVQFRRLLGDEVFLEVAGRTVAIALIVTAITLLLAYPLAYALLRAKGAVKAVLIALVALPYLTSVLVRVYAWAALLSLEGPINAILVRLGLFKAPLLLGHSMVGTGIGMVHILCPIAALTMWSQMERIDRSGTLVAKSLGASPVRAFVTVFLPQSAPGAVTAGMIVYVLSLGAYVIPAALGGTKGLLFAQLVVDQATQLLDWELSGAMGVLMLTIAAIPVLVLLAIGVTRRRTSSSTGATTLQHLADRLAGPLMDGLPGGVARLAAHAAACGTLLFLLLPEFVVLVFSLGPQHQVVLPPPSLSLDGYRSVLTDPGWLQAGQRSLAYASADAVIATALGTIAAYGFVRGSVGWARAGTAILLTPLVLPEILTAISFFIFATKAQLAGTDSGIILGQAVGTVGLVVLVVSAAIRGVDPTLEHAAHACGASRLRTLRDIVAPLILPGMFVGFLYAFLHAFDDLVTPLFIAGTRATIPVRMFLTMQEQLTSAPAVIASLLIIVLAAALAVGLVLALLDSRILAGMRQSPKTPA